MLMDFNKKILTGAVVYVLDNSTRGWKEIGVKGPQHYIHKINVSKTDIPVDCTRKGRDGPGGKYYNIAASSERDQDKI